MSKKITMYGHSHKSVAEVFDDFVISLFCFGNTLHRLASPKFVLFFG